MDVHEIVLRKVPVMKKPIILLLAFLWVLPVQAKTGPEFSHFFRDRTLRMDYVHSGTKTTSFYSLNHFYEEGKWPGSTTNLVDTLNLGKYLLRIFDLKTNQLIYSYGYSTLFGEWQTTDEAMEGTSRSFSETVRFPYPKRPVQITISERDRQNIFHEKFSTIIDPNSRLISREKRIPLTVMVKPLLKSGDPHQKVDIAVISDAYTIQEKEKFFSDARKRIDVLLNTEPYKSHKNRINVWAVFAPSRESGPDEPRKGIYHNTAISTSFNSLDLPRYLMTTDNQALHDIAAAAPYDNIYILVNSSRYGGGAIYNFYAVCISNNKWSNYIFVHEFGHAFGGLADEYYSSKVTYNDFYPPGIEPWEPNITALLNPKNLKWKALVTPGTPIPTPPDSAKYGNVVGAFEGAGYVAKGLYRPTLNSCIMFRKQSKKYCPVCQQAILRVIQFKSE